MMISSLIGRDFILLSGGHGKEGWLRKLVSGTDVLFALLKTPHIQSREVQSWPASISLSPNALSHFLVPFNIPRPHLVPTFLAYLNSVSWKNYSSRDRRKNADEKISIPLTLINSVVWAIGQT